MDQITFDAETIIGTAITHAPDHDCDVFIYSLNFWQSSATAGTDDSFFNVESAIASIDSTLAEVTQKK